MAGMYTASELAEIEAGFKTEEEIALEEQIAKEEAAEDARDKEMRDERFDNLPQSAKVIWEQCTWVDEDELSDILDICEHRGITDLDAMNGVDLLKLLREFLPHLTRNEHAELKEIAQAAKKHSIATAFQVVANKRLLDVVTHAEREAIYRLYEASSDEPVSVRAYREFLRKQRIDVTPNVDEVLSRQDGVWLHDALATFYSLKVAVDPSKYPTSPAFNCRLKEVYSELAEELSEKDLQDGAEAESPEDTILKASGEAHDIEQESGELKEFLLRREHVIPALKKIGWFKMETEDDQQLLKDIEEEIADTPAVDFRSFVGFAECFSPPDPLQKRLIEAKEILENAFYEVAEVDSSGTRILPMAKIEETFRIAGIDFQKGDLEEVLSVAREEGIESGFNVKQWWEVMRQVVSPSKDALWSSCDTFFERKTGGSNASVPIEDIVNFLSTLDDDLACEVSEAELEKCRKDLRLSKRVKKTEFEKAVQYLLDKKADEATHAARREERERQSEDAHRRSVRAPIPGLEGEEEEESYFFMVVGVFLFICFLVYVFYTGHIPGQTLWSQVRKMLDLDTGSGRPKSMDL
jgi:hypothetical protein